VKVLGIQLETRVGQVDANYARALAFLEHGARVYRPDVILLPEAFAAYMARPDMEAVAEPVPGPTTDRFCSYSAQYQTMILFGLIRQNPHGDGVYNSAILVDGGQIIGIYDKTHLTMNLLPEERAMKNEQEIYLAGDRLGLFDTRFGRIGVMICHDGNYPEVFRALALEGARALFWIMNTTVDLSAWAKLHALWNTTPIFTCNRVIRDSSGVRRYGYSVFADVHGNPLDAAATAEAYLFADVDLDEQASFRAAGLHGSANQMRVRRPELYGALTRPKDQ
jgi:predicted amidohydrolase